MAKRQITWLRSQQDGVWFDSGEDLPLHIIEHYLADSELLKNH